MAGGFQENKEKKKPWELPHGISSLGFRFQLGRLGIPLGHLCIVRSHGHFDAHRSLREVEHPVEDAVIVGEFPFTGSELVPQGIRGSREFPHGFIPLRSGNRIVAVPATHPLVVDGDGLLPILVDGAGEHRPVVSVDGLVAADRPRLQEAGTAVEVDLRRRDRGEVLDGGLDPHIAIRGELVVDNGRPGSRHRLHDALVGGDDAILVLRLPLDPVVLLHLALLGCVGFSTLSYGRWIP